MKQKTKWALISLVIMSCGLLFPLLLPKKEKGRKR